MRPTVGIVKSRALPSLNIFDTKASESNRMEPQHFVCKIFSHCKKFLQLTSIRFIFCCLKVVFYLLSLKLFVVYKTEEKNWGEASALKKHNTMIFTIYQLSLLPCIFKPRLNVARLLWAVTWNLRWSSLPHFWRLPHATLSSIKCHFFC